jgi:hypothetical protein
MKNVTGALSYRGTTVIADTANEGAFIETTSNLYDQVVLGVLDEDVPDGGFGNVVLLGIAEVRATSPTTRGQYLRTSNTGSNAEGTTTPTIGTFGVSLSSRNTATGRVLALVGLTPNTRGTLNVATTTVDVVNSAVKTAIYQSTITGNTLGTARRLRLALMCDVANNTGVDRTVILELVYGATTLVVTEAITLAASAATRIVTVVADVVARGATNVQLAALLARITFPNAATTGTGTDIDADRLYHGTAAEDSTADKTLTVNVTLSAASGSLEFRMRYALLEIS